MAIVFNQPQTITQLLDRSLIIPEYLTPLQVAI